MAVETELKLRIAPEHMARLKRHPFLKALAVAPARNRKLHNIYFDTPDLDMQNHAMALRLRRVSRNWVQTLKGGGGLQAGLHSRNEWETPVAGEALDFVALEACGGRLPPGVQKRLRPVFATDFFRSVRQLHYGGASIELCMDSGEIRAGARTRPISELELELKSGEPGQLFRLALALLDLVPLEVEHINKAVYGYQLAFPRRRGPSRVRFPELIESQPVALVLRDILSACLLYVQANLPGMLWKPDGDYREELRAGMRRLDTVLEVAGAWSPDSELDSLREQVGALCAELTRAHEWEALATGILPRLLAELPGQPGLREIARACAKTSKQHEAGVLAHLASRDLPRLLLRAGLWMQGSYPQESGKGGESLADFGKRTLQGYSEEMHQYGTELTQAHGAHLDALCDACRKLGNSAEVFGPLFPADRTGPYLAALAELQERLVGVCEIAAAGRLLEEAGDGKRSDALTVVAGWLERERARRMKELEKAWQRFVGQGAFWA